MKYQGWRWRSLSTRVTLFVLAIFLASLWSLTIYLSQRLHQDMERVLSEQQFTVVELLAASINTELQNRLQALTLVAGGIDESMLQKPAALQQYLKDRVLLHPMFNAGVHIVGGNGVALADVSKVPNRVGSDFSSNSSIQNALRYGQSSVGRPLLGPLLKQAVFPIVAPIFDRQGRPIGAIAGTTNLASPNFVDVLGQTHFGKTGAYMLVAPKHRLIVTAHDKSRTMQTLAASANGSRYDRFLNGYEGSEVVVDPQGASVLASAKAIPAADWILLATLPSDEAFASVHSLMQSMLLATALLTVLTGALTHWMLRRTLAPLSSAANTLMELSGNDEPAPPLTITRRDEIGQLLAAFNRMLAKLGQREVLVKKILDTASVAIFVVDHEGRITQANERMDEMFGCPNGALVGSEYIDLVYPIEREIARQNMQSLLAAEIPPVDLNRRFCRIDGTEFWGHLTARHFYNTGTERRALVGVIVDITERKTAQEKLLQHDQRFTAIIENFPGGISMIDNDLRLVACNEPFKQLLDLPNSLFEKEDLTLEDILRFNAQRGEFGPGDVEEQVRTRIERSRKFEPHKFERVRPSGQVLEVLGAVVPGGGFVTIYLDITERKRQDEAMNELTSRLLRFRTAMDATRDAIYLVDRASLRFIDVNASACNMLGLSREEILAAGPAGVLGYAPQELARIYDEIIADGGVSAPVEVLRTRGSGRQAWVEIQRHAQRSDEGWMIVTVARDITDRKEMEDQVRQLAFYDPLTRLANRRLLNDRLAKAIAASKRSGCYGALIFLDLDNFKSLNDTHGHGAGDLLLVEAARRLSTCVREIDTVARLGGDEFVVVVGDLDDSTGVSTMKATFIAEKIKKAIGEPYLLTVKVAGGGDRPVEHRCTASIGVVVFHDSEGTQEDFLRWADTAMYQAKEAGSNMIRFFQSQAVVTAPGRQ